MSRTYKKWTQAEIEFIVQNSGMKDEEMAVKLSSMTGQSISQSMVRRQRRKSGVKKQRGRPRKNAQVSSVAQPTDSVVAN